MRSTVSALRLAAVRSSEICGTCPSYPRRRAGSRRDSRRLQ
jgi:hypothetical protein